MYGIVLSERDRRILLAIDKDDDGGLSQTHPLPDTEEEIEVTLIYLESCGLVQTWRTQDRIAGVRLSDFGHKFLMENPKAKSETQEETKWKISAALSALAILISIAALLVSLLR